MLKFLVLFFFSFSFVYSITFNQLIEKTLQNSPYLKSKYLDVNIAKEELNIVDSAFYPTINVGYVSEEVNSLNSDQVSTYIDSNSVSNEDIKKSYSFVNLNYNLYSFGRVSLKSDIQKELVDSKKYKYCIVLKDMFQNLLQEYYEARIAFLKIQYLEELLKLQNQIFTYKNKLFALGEVDKITVVESSLQIANSYSNKLEVINKLENSIIALEKITHTKLKTTDLEPLSYNKYSDILEFDSSPNGLYLQHKISSKAKEISYYEREFLPNVNFYAKYDFYGSSTKSYSEAMDNMDKNSYKLGVSISWNFFNGFKTISQKNKTKLELQQLKYQYLHEKEEFNSTRKLSISNIDSLKKEKKELQNILDLSNQNKINSKKLYKIGELSKVETLTKEIEILNKKQELESMNEKLVFEKLKKNLLSYGVNQCIVH